MVSQDSNEDGADNFIYNNEMEIVSFDSEQPSEEREYEREESEERNS